MKIERKLVPVQEKARAYLKNANLLDSQIADLEKIGFFTAPASKGHHLNCQGGLCLHSINVCDLLIAYGAFQSRTVAYRVGMLHDLVKCFCYKFKKDFGIAFVQPSYPGHGIASALICADLQISLTPAARSAIVWHMGAFGLDEDQLKEYHAALSRYPKELILTHACDHLASIYEAEDVVV